MTQKHDEMDLFYDYRNNVALYPQWQKFLRERHPDTIIFWGQNDMFFTPEEGEAYLRDLPNAEMHCIDPGHFAVEDWKRSPITSSTSMKIVAKALIRRVIMTVNTVFSHCLTGRCGIWMRSG